MKDENRPFTPVFFPFTTIDAHQMAAIGSGCPALGLYLPSELDVAEPLRRWAAEGRLHLHVPVTHDSDRLRAVLADYRCLAAIHGPGVSTQLKALAALPLWNPESTPDLMGAIAGQSTFQKDRLPDPLFQARVFLHLAQDLDQRQAELIGDMEGLVLKEQALYEMLGGQSAIGRPELRPTVHDPGATLTAQRLRAWARLVLAGSPLPSLMVTTSRAVWDYLLDIHPKARIVARFAGIPSPAALDAVCQNLSQAALAGSGDQDPATEPPFTGQGPDLTLTLALIDQCRCRGFLAGLAGADLPPAGSDASAPPLLALVA